MRRINTDAATAARRRIGQETAARKLREAGWLVVPPERADDYVEAYDSATDRSNRNS